MIKVLHIYPKDDHSTARYVALLSKALPDSFESKCSDDLASLKKMCRDWQPDIVHQYGALSVDVPGRRVVSPCGNTFDNQKSYYAVIARSPLEAESLNTQGITRVEIIRNPLVTKTTNFDETAQKITYVYQKVMDSNPLPLMDEETRTLLFQLLKVAVLGDKRWVPGFTFSPDTVNFRLLLHYASLEGVLPLIQKGLSILRIDAPEYKKIACYLPEAYVLPKSMSGQDIIDMVKDVQRNGLSLLRLVNLFEALHHPDINEDQLLNNLESEELLSLFSSILSILKELLSLEDGFMPCESVDNSETRRLRNNITNHLQL